MKMAKFNILDVSKMGSATDFTENTYLLSSDKGIEAEWCELNDISMEDLRNMKKVLISQARLETVIF